MQRDLTACAVKVEPGNQVSQRDDDRLADAAYAADVLSGLHGARTLGWRTHKAAQGNAACADLDTEPYVMTPLHRAERVEYLCENLRIAIHGTAPWPGTRQPSSPQALSVSVRRRTAQSIVMITLRASALEA